MPKSHTKRSVQGVMEVRIAQVAKWLMDGHVRYEIVEMSEAKWKVKSFMTDKYIRRAKLRLQEINNVSLSQNEALITGNLWDLFRKAKKAANLDEAHKVLMSIAKIKGLGKQQITHMIEDKRELSHLSDEELEAILISEDEFNALSEQPNDCA